METVKVVVHIFSVGDVEDPELYAAQPIWEWQQTDAGKWVMEHSADTIWHRYNDIHTYSVRYAIVASLTESDATWYKLKYQ